MSPIIALVLVLGNYPPTFYCCTPAPEPENKVVCQGTITSAEGSIKLTFEDGVTQSFPLVQIDTASVTQFADGTYQLKDLKLTDAKSGEAVGWITVTGVGSKDEAGAFQYSADIVAFGAAGDSQWAMQLQKIDEPLGRGGLQSYVSRGEPIPLEGDNRYAFADWKTPDNADQFAEPLDKPESPLAFVDFADDSGSAFTRIGVTRVEQLIVKFPPVCCLVTPPTPGNNPGSTHDASFADDLAAIPPFGGRFGLLGSPGGGGGVGGGRSSRTNGGNPTTNGDVLPQPPITNGDPGDPDDPGDPPPEIHPTPEPSTLVLLLLGASALGIRRRREPAPPAHQY